MTTPNHTPGPWALGIETDDDRAQVINNDGWHVAYVACDPLDANARLIAAAPCMLLALTIARAHIRRALEEIPENDGNLSGALAVIGDAITKATGGDFE